MLKDYSSIIIGGGASGLAAAISFARLNVLNKKAFNCLIIEKNDRLGKKLALTGNGRCNLLNSNIDFNNYNNGEFVRNIISLCGNFQGLKDFFDTLGIITKNYDNLVYPYSESANSVVDALRFECSRLNIDTLLNSEVKSIKMNNDKSYKVLTSNGDFTCKCLIIATGSNASGGFNSLPLFNDLGHTYKRFLPSLVPLKCDKYNLNGLFGVRIKCTASLKINDKVIVSENGEILFKDYGITGIAVLSLSRYLNKENGKKIILLDLMPEYSKDEVLKLLKYRIDNKILNNFDNIHTGITHKAIINNIIKNNNIVEINQNTIKIIAENLKNYEIKVIDVCDYSLAQICSGGVNTFEIDKDTLESKIDKNLFICGEVTDIDGDCGGYNLSWCFASGITTGKNAYANIIKEK